MSFFDVPSGYSDADLEMAELEQRGRDWARLVKRVGGEDNLAALRAGATVTVQRFADGRGPYVALVRMVDPHDDGLLFSVDGGWSWYETAKLARLAVGRAGEVMPST